MAITDLFKQCGFKIQLKDGKHIEMFVQEANIPGITLGQMDIGWQAMKDKRTGDSIEYNDFTLTIILDEDLKVYKEIYNSLILAHNPDTNTLEVQDNLFDGYFYLLTNKNNIQHTLHLFDAWIKNIDDIQLTHTSSEDEQITVTMTICYNYFLFE